MWWFVAAFAAGFVIALIIVMWLATRNDLFTVWK